MWYLINEKQWLPITLLSSSSSFYLFQAVTIKNGGNVLVPCYPSGVVYDLFECLSGYMDSVKSYADPYVLYIASSWKLTSLHTDILRVMTPCNDSFELLYNSGNSRKVLKRFKIYCTLSCRLCAAKQSRVYLPEPPFPHAELIKNGRLQHFSSLHGLYCDL